MRIPSPGLVLFCLLWSPLVAMAGPRVVGNGGDVLKPQPISIEEIEQAIPDSKRFIVSWLHQIEDEVNSLNPDSNTLIVFPPKGAEKLFFSHPNVYEVVEDLKIKYAIRSACPSNNHHRDGSVIDMSSDEICISGYTLQNSLNKENFEWQVPAVIVHEISHLLGCDEAEAVDLQTRYRDDMKQVSIFDLNRQKDLLSVGEFNYSYWNSIDPIYFTGAN